MENKAPEKKVRLREEDVFYVYDKRINKCVKDDCCGTVKYGLNLQVNMPNGDTLNTYECNKCHMKYTAYPNYVRLAFGNKLVILNRDEVALRDKKRRDDARKQAKLDKQQGHAKYKREDGFKKRRNTDDNKTYSKPYRKNEYGKTCEKPYTKYNDDRQNDKTYEKPYKKPYNNKYAGEKSYDRPYKKFDDNRKYGEGKSYDRNNNKNNNGYNSYRRSYNNNVTGIDGYRNEKRTAATD